MNTVNFFPVGEVFKFKMHIHSDDLVSCSIFTIILGISYFPYFFYEEKKSKTEDTHVYMNTRHCKSV